jgi:ATP-dependent Lon protease
MFGNTNQPIDVMVQTGHLFAPVPDVIRDDMAFIDRMHFYLPGWEISKMWNNLFTDHYGFVVDYLAEALREMRKHNFTEIIDRYFSLGTHLNARDPKAVRKTVSGLTKILFPHGEVVEEELAEILELALEGRKRVKEQLKKMGSFEYYHTSFSNTVQETGEEKFVGAPDQGGRNLIRSEPLPPGIFHTAGSRLTEPSVSTASKSPSRAVRASSSLPGALLEPQRSRYSARSPSCRGRKPN